MEIFKVLRLLGDEGRVRILRLLVSEELSVLELQEILGMGQSRISMQLSQLKQAGLVDVRKMGQKSLYRYTSMPGIQDLVTEVIERAGDSLTEAPSDDASLGIILNRRKDKLRTYFDDLAGRFGRNYVPGRSWKALAEMLFRLLPPLVIADLGAGEGTIAFMLSQRAERVIAVDNSENMVAYGSETAVRNGLTNLEYRLGDLEQLPIGDAEVDLALFHQTLHHALHPGKAIHEAWRVLKPGGRVVVLDLLKHDFEAARELYADLWLGFSLAELSNFLEQAGFVDIELSTVSREEDPPHLQTTLAIAVKP